MIVKQVVGVVAGGAVVMGSLFLASFGWVALGRTGRWFGLALSAVGVAGGVVAIIGMATL